MGGIVIKGMALFVLVMIASNLVVTGFATIPFAPKRRDFSTSSGKGDPERSTTGILLVRASSFS